MKKKVKSLLMLLLCLSMMFVTVACDNDTDKDNSEENSQTEISLTEYAGDAIVVQDLGRMELEAYPVDVNYDWKCSVIQDGDIYKMYWCRQYNQDAIWYAESTDMKTWTNEQVVLDIPAESFYDREWLKLHCANPSVVIVDGTYYLFFEGPSTVLATGECDNQVFLATSTDGLNFTMYPSNEDPQPIVKMPEEKMGEGRYGVGQPSVVYKDGLFHLWYTDAVDGSFMRYATSEDGIHFGNYEDHPVVFDAATVGVCYNALIDKYIMAYRLDKHEAVDASLTRRVDIYLNFSDDGIHWETSFKDSKDEYIVSSDEFKTRNFPAFCTNEYGHITTTTMYVTYMEADRLHGVDEDFRYTSPSWDGHIAAVNLKEFAKKEMILPSGEVLSEESLKQYEDSGLTYEKTSGIAQYGTPTIDLVKEDLWDNSPKLEINRRVTRWGTEASDTTGTVQFMWDEEALYAYGVIYDENVSYSHPGGIDQLYQKDSIDIFINVSNEQKQYLTEWKVPTKDWTIDAYFFEICANGTYIVKSTNGTNEIIVTNALKGAQIYTNITETGWEFEIKMPWYPLAESYVEANRVIGLEMQINDDPGIGMRRSQIVWNDIRGAAFQNLDCLGDLKLAK